MCKFKFSILTLGCKVNYYDSNIVKKMLDMQMDIKTISEATGLEVDEIKKLNK